MSLFGGVLTQIFWPCYNATHISDDGRSTQVGVLKRARIGWKLADRDLRKIAPELRTERVARYATVIRL